MQQSSIHSTSLAKEVKKQEDDAMEQELEHYIQHLEAEVDSRNEMLDFKNHEITGLHVSLHR